MIRFLAIADIHLGSYPRSGLTREDDIMNALVNIASYAGTNKINTVIVAGDIFKSKNPSPQHYRIFNMFLHLLVMQGISVEVIPGNHDVSRGDTSSTALDPYTAIPGGPSVHVHVSPTLKVIDGQSFLFFPYTTPPQEEKLQDYIKQSNYDPSKIILVMHGTVEGAMMNRHVDYEIYDEDMIKADTANQFQMVLAGHLHDGHNVGNVWYPGSIENLSFSDEGAEKSFLDIEVGGAIKKVALNPRKFITLTYDYIPKVKSGEISVKDQVVRVFEADKNSIPEIDAILKKAKCYFVSSIQPKVDEKVATNKLNRQNLVLKEFIEKYAARYGYKGKNEEETKVLVDSAANLIVQMLNDQT